MQFFYQKSVFVLCIIFMISNVFAAKSSNPASQAYVDKKAAALQAQIDNLPPAPSGTTIKIGDTYGGGIVYFIDNKNRQGLIAATADVGATYTWGLPANSVSTSLNLFQGLTNTQNMLAQPSGSPAASAANSINPASSCAAPISSCTAWYLPSQNELSLLWDTRIIAGVTGFNSLAGYWTSTQDSNNNINASVVNFDFGDVVTFVYKLGTFRVRPVRAFTY